MPNETTYPKYLKWIGLAVAFGLAVWILSIIASLGSWLVSIGIVAFVGFIFLVNRLTRKMKPTTGQPSPEHRVVSTDQDRWGGGASL